MSEQGGYEEVLASIERDEYGQPIEELEPLKTYPPLLPEECLNDASMTRTVGNWREAHGLPREYTATQVRPKVGRCGGCDHPIPAHQPQCRVKGCECDASS